MYSLKQVSEITGKPLRTIQNWFKGVNPKETDNKTRARFFDDEIINETLKKQNIDFSALCAQWHANNAQEDHAETPKNAELAHDGTPNGAQRANDAPNGAQDLISLFEKQISFYQAQLEEKDKQISNLSASLAKSNELLQNEQQLNLLNLKQIEDLKTQLLLDKPKENTEKPKEEIEVIENDNQNKKKSFFSRLFNL